jgi:hypothetical protein
LAIVSALFDAVYTSLASLYTLGYPCILLCALGSRPIPFYNLGPLVRQLSALEPLRRPYARRDLERRTVLISLLQPCTPFQPCGLGRCCGLDHCGLGRCCSLGHRCSLAYPCALICLSSLGSTCGLPHSCLVLGALAGFGALAALCALAALHALAQGFQNSLQGVTRACKGAMGLQGG